jgi:hypothetical protein
MGKLEKGAHKIYGSNRRGKRNEGHYKNLPGFTVYAMFYLKKSNVIFVNYILCISLPYIYTISLHKSYMY